MIKNFSTEKSQMQRIILILLITILPVLPLAAQPTWSGNASVDQEEFVNFVDDVPLAGASSSFTRNTVITVTNPQNNRSVEVTIVKRAPRPGVFLVLSEAAGKALSLAADQVIPVQVQVAESISTSEYDEFNSVDPDINPALTVPAEEETELGAPSISEDSPEESIPELTEDFTTAPGFSYDEPLPVPLPADALRVDRAPADAIPDTEEAAASVGMTDAADDESPSEPADPLPILVPVLAEDSEDRIEESESEADPESDSIETLEDSLLPTGDNVIYFLTPSDFRPPVQTAADSDKSEDIVPVLVDRETLEDYIVNQLNNGSSYIQLGAYSSAESIYSEIVAIEARYPMLVWTEQRNGRTLYKLLIGPLTQDETGVLSYRFRDSGYADLFLYKP